MGPQSGGVVRTVVRTATAKDLDLLVRHRRLMWEAIADFSIRDHDAADAVYRRWARDRMRSRRFAGFIVEVGAEPVASGCVWIMDVQPRPGRSGTAAAYLLSMFTEPDHRREGHATRIARAAIRWARSRGIPIEPRSGGPGPAAFQSCCCTPRISANRSIVAWDSSGPGRCVDRSFVRRATGPAPPGKPRVGQRTEPRLGGTTQAFIYDLDL